MGVLVTRSIEFWWKENNKRLPMLFNRFGKGLMLWRHAELSLVRLIQWVTVWQLLLISNKKPRKKIILKNVNTAGGVDFPKSPSSDFIWRATLSLAFDRVTAKKGSLRSPRGRLVASLLEEWYCPYGTRQVITGKDLALAGQMTMKHSAVLYLLINLKLKHPPPASGHLNFWRLDCSNSFPLAPK